MENDTLKVFHITGVARADLQGFGYDTENVSDDTMRAIASQMAEAYVGGQFWADLKIITNSMGVPKK